MWGLALFALAIFGMIVGALMGFLSMLLASSTSVGKSTAFAWGAIFGPFGIVAMALVAMRRRNQILQSSMERNEGISRTLALIGAVLTSLALMLPWFGAAGLDRELSLIPLTTPALRGVAFLVFVMTLLGVTFLLAKKSVLLIGCIGSLMFNTALIVWFLGSRLITFLGIEVVPIDSAITIGRGASVALLGAILILVSSLFMLIGRTWSSYTLVTSTRAVVIGTVATGLVVMVRDVIWVRFDTANVSWGLPADGIPVIGDLLVLLLVAGAFSTAISIFYRATWLHVIGVCCGSLIIIGSLLTVTFAGVVNRALDWLRSQSPSLLSQSLDTSTTRGPYLTAIVGLVLCVYGVINLFSGKSLMVQGNDGGTISPMTLAPPDLPF